MATKSTSGGDRSEHQPGHTPAVEREGTAGHRPQVGHGGKGSTDIEEDTGTNVRGDVEHEIDEDEDDDEQDVITERNPRQGDLMADRARGPRGR